MNILLEQIYLNDLHNNETFTTQVQFLINNLKAHQNVASQNIATSQNTSQNITSPQNTTSQNNTSHFLGQEGQQTVLQLLQRVFKDVIDQSRTAHVGDILVNYLDRTIMFEVKNKQTISKEDIIKFQDDLRNFDLGVFISLRTDYIPQFGSFDMVDNQIYLSKDFINIQTFTLLKTFIERYFSSPKDTQDTQNAQNLQDICQRDLQMISVFKQDLIYLQTLFQKAQIKQRELDQIQEEIQSKIRIYIHSLQDYKNQNNLLYDFQKKDLQTYILQTPRNLLRKTYLVQKYDKLQLQQYTLDQIVELFGKKDIPDGIFI